MSLVQDFGGGSSSNGSSEQVITVPATVPVGSTLIISALGLGLSTAIAMDSKNNTYWTVGQSNSTSENPTTTHLIYSRVGIELLAGDTITVDYSGTVVRSAVSVLHFSETLEATSAISDTNNGLSGKDLTIAPTDSVEAGALVVGSFGLSSAGRIPTGANGSTVGTKYSSTVGGGERAVFPAYKYATASGTQTIDATLDVASSWCGVGSGFKPYVEPEPPIDGAYGSVIVGGVKKTVTNVSVVVGGAKKTVTRMSVIVGGVKKTVSQ